MNKFLKLNLQFFALDTGISFQTKDGGVQLSASEFLEYKKLQKQQETEANRPFVGYGPSQTKTAGEIFVNSQAYKNFISNGQNSSDNVTIPPFPTKALLTSVGEDGRLLSPMNIAGVGQPPMTLRDLLAVAPTQNNSVEYIKEVGFTNASAIAPEGTLKPESSISFETVSALVKVIAHWIPTTRQIIADVPSIRSYIDMRLMYGLSVTEEAQILYGSGVGENILGLMVTPDTQTYTPLVDDTKIDTIRKAMTMTYISGFPPTGIVLNPLDFQDIELSKGTDGHYIFLNVAMGAETKLFRVPVVLSTSMNQGEFLTGAFGLGAQLWSREEKNVRISEHHADFFVKNMLAVLCEQRIALTIQRPESLVKGTFEPIV